MMLYPENINIKKSNFIINLMLVISIIVGIILLIINYLVNNNIHWAILSVAGIVYVWITTLYSIDKNINIAFYVMIQFICVSILSVVIDYSIGYKGWSVNLAIPIIAVVANITMFVLTIVSRKRYLRYALYHIIIFIFSMIPVLLYILKITKEILPIYILLGISLITLVVTVILCGRDMLSETKRRLHI